jgi:hypothetical protein
MAKLFNLANTWNIHQQQTTKGRKEAAKVAP